VVVSLHLDWFYDIAQGDHMAKMASYLATTARDHMRDKPYVVSWRCYRAEPGLEQVKTMLQQELLSAGVPVYHGLARTAAALARLAEYHQFHKQERPQARLP
jgi:acyl-CoA synthetase (NDP forming)